MTKVVQIQKFHHCSRSALRFPKDEDKKGRASEKCRKKAGGSANFDSDVWRPRIEEQTISISEPIELDSVIPELKNQFIVSYE